MFDRIDRIYLPNKRKLHKFYALAFAVHYYRRTPAAS